MLSDDDIKEFQAVYKKHSKKEISYELAYEMYSKLLALTKEIFSPMTKEGYKKLQERRKELGLPPDLENEFVYCDYCKEYHDSSEFSLRLAPKDDLRLRCFTAVMIRLNNRRLKKIIKEWSINNRRTTNEVVETHVRYVHF